jgi:hypothetical protein
MTVAALIAYLMAIEMPKAEEPPRWSDDFPCLLSTASNSFR